MSVNVRQAEARNVPEMARLVNDYAEQDLMLHRSLLELYEGLRDFQVAERGGDLVGVVGLRIMWADLAEIYALAVPKELQGQGIGGQLVRAVTEEARRLGIRRVFALTYEQAFFERLGFEAANRNTLPMKVWSECIRCPKRQACDEITMICVLKDVEDVLPAAEMADEGGKYVVPVLSESLQRIASATRGPGADGDVIAPD